MSNGPIVKSDNLRAVGPVESAEILRAMRGRSASRPEGYEVAAVNVPPLVPRSKRRDVETRSK